LDSLIFFELTVWFSRPCHGWHPWLEGRLPEIRRTWKENGRRKVDETPNGSPPPTPSNTSDSGNPTIAGIPRGILTLRFNLEIKLVWLFAFLEHGHLNS
jgi:hypothetical protein